MHPEPLAQIILLIVIGIAQMIQITIMLRLLHVIDKPDLSKEGAEIESAKEQLRETSGKVSDAINKLKG